MVKIRLDKCNKWTEQQARITSQLGLTRDELLFCSINLVAAFCHRTSADVIEVCKLIMVAVNDMRKAGAIDA